MNVKPLLGQHHVSAITANAQRNFAFYTKTLGMRLVKKTINQDDPSMYHLFYADERGNPGTDLTFFEIPRAGQTRFGTNSISLTSLRVPTDASVEYWNNRFEHEGVKHEAPAMINGRLTILFQDFEAQRLALVSDENNTGVAGGKPWANSPIPAEHGIIGLGPVKLTMNRMDDSVRVLTEVMGYREKDGFQLADGNSIRVFETGEGGTGAELYLEERLDLPTERPGRGSVHHVAFRVENEDELNKWAQHISDHGLPNSGVVERYYFKALYFREPSGILYELSTDGPGFVNDEPFEHLGETLALPPYFEDQREMIEAKLEPLETNQ